MHLLHLKTIKLYIKSNLIVSSRFFIQIKKKSIQENLMIILRKIVLPIKLLFSIYLNKIERQKELTAQLQAPFKLFLLSKSFLRHCKPKLQKQLFIQEIKALSIKVLPLHIINLKIKNLILSIFVFLNFEFVYIYPKKSARS